MNDGVESGRWRCGWSRQPGMRGVMAWERDGMQEIHFMMERQNDRNTDAFSTHHINYMGKSTQAAALLIHARQGCVDLTLQQRIPPGHLRPGEPGDPLVKLEVQHNLICRLHVDSHDLSAVPARDPGASQAKREGRGRDGHGQSVCC
ncbi:hypothetical protein E2C01_101732 [Portunus trituberculatus]|uniref:Uncharacterized protein n=1 Tax=Portunus trituberculatus TaxID=210409 RepID=A0A5B7KGS9_PORTR|nr:hypothetical protein [Portunus trituberculatus]